MAKKSKKAKSTKVKSTKRPASNEATAAPSPTMRPVYRDTLTGRFVTKKYAKKNRKTTTKELPAP